MVIDDDLEHFACWIMVPPGIIEKLDIQNRRMILNECFGFDEYRLELDDLAFSPDRNPDDFRELVIKYKDLFGDLWDDVNQMEDAIIDYVLERVREERVGMAFDNYCNYS